MFVHWSAAAPMLCTAESANGRMLPATVSDVRVPTDVIVGCAAVVTVPAVVAVDALPVKAPIKVVAVIVPPFVISFEFRSRFASVRTTPVPDGSISTSELVFSETSLLPFRPNSVPLISDDAVIAPDVTAPDTARLVNVPTDVIVGCAAVVTVPAVVAVSAFPVTLPVRLPTNAVDVIDVAPVTTPAATLIVPSNVRVPDDEISSPSIVMLSTVTEVNAPVDGVVAPMVVLLIAVSTIESTCICAA